MKRIAATIAVAALAVGASATTASARPCCDEPDDPGLRTLAPPVSVGAPLTHATKTKKAKKLKAPVKKDTRPAKIVYRGPH